MNVTIVPKSLPQHFSLDVLHRDYPNATYILPLRTPLDWAKSVFNWFDMRGRVISEYVAFNQSIKRPGKAGAIDFLARIYHEHNDFIRDFVRRHPTHALVEVNLTDPAAGEIMATAFGFDAECWGHHNKFGNRTAPRVHL